MIDENQIPMEKLLNALQERTKELGCLYRVEELFSQPGITLPEILEGIVQAIPAGWQYVDVCEAQITIGSLVVTSPGYRDTPWTIESPLTVQDQIVGRIMVVYLEERPAEDEGPFLKEERKLIDTIADRLERRILHENLRLVFERERERATTGVEWRIIIDLLRRTDPKLLARISRKMLYHLAWAGVDDVNPIIEDFSNNAREEGDPEVDENRPLPLTLRRDFLDMTEQIFEIAANHISESEILSNIQKWIKEDRSGFLVRILENPVSSLAEITNAIERFHHLAPQGLELSLPRERSFRVSLIRRLLSDHSAFIGAAKHFIDVDDFFDLLRHVIHPAGSHGKLGGKAAGLVLASHVLERDHTRSEIFGDVRTPRTWYLTSDGILNFIDSNDLEEIVELKYEDLARVRQEYPYVVHVFKNSPLPPEILNGLSVALDDLPETPLIVRSSSLLEDRLGTSFAGKYKSLFIANQGSKRERLASLVDAITEVYASTFGPDPIEYRSEHGLLDFHEEMGILIQEVAGARVGRYYMPAFAGVAFSHNEFRWSKRIRREDGLIRMVPGLGTRAVDRMSDDYPILVAPGQPSLRVNVTLDEKVRYSPKMMDVINLETNSLETVEVDDLLREFGDEYPMLHQLVSILREDRLVQPTALGIEPQNDRLVMTFERLISETTFVEQIRTILDVLQQELRMPVDIEFAHDGKDLYLVQCRPQSYGAASIPAVIPHDLPHERIVFTAKRYVSNGTVSGITHIVYVDADRYDELPDRADRLAVGRAVGRLNQILPKRQFILMGPGRWGSRGDIRLGVSVTYSDIHNTSMLLEIARKRRDYVPELSFGTHFFQDLVEANIRYLPLYPDEPDVILNEDLLIRSRNALPDLLPDFARFADVIRVIDVPAETGGMTLQVLMNGDSDEAMGLLTETTPEIQEPQVTARFSEAVQRVDDSHWQWRLRMVEQMASVLDAQRYGVHALYLFGSTKNATAGSESDIDLLIHFKGEEHQRRELSAWLDAWSLALGHLNYLRTGRRIERLLDVHFVTDEDLRRRTSFAAKIGAVTDAARPIPLAGRVGTPSRSGPVTAP
ncbi:MAG: PEP/pyruvate-binding domain-containing protein [Thermoanaerobaculia bacterium]